MVLGLLLAPMSGVSVASADPTSPPAEPASREPASRESASRESVSPLGTAGRVLAGDALATDPSATLALRDLWMARPDLAGTDALEATALLARPTDGAADPFDNGYTVPATRECGTKVCVHYVPTTADAPPSPEWVALTLSTMETVYDREVRQLGYRAPRKDGIDGGDGRLDVYLKDLGVGLYGYCAAERDKAARTASGFCVLDNDYSPTQFPAKTPEDNLRVTAAHEFFHTVQYSYDYAQDPWMLESTATWMEEQVFDDVNDNRQYLRQSQLQAPYVHLDAFSSTFGFQYGNWIFWEYLTERFSTGFVKKAWESAGSLRNDGRNHSIDAVKAVLRKKRQSFTNVYADFAAANTTPALTYPEAPGVAEYANPLPLADETLTRADKRHVERKKVDHLAAEAINLRPAAELSGRRWKLRVNISGPPRSSSPAARLIVHKIDGTLTTRRVRFSDRGRAQTLAPFSSTEILAVTVSFANVSTRFRCGQGTDFVCQGEALDDNRLFTVVAKAVKPPKKRRG